MWIAAVKIKWDSICEGTKQMAYHPLNIKMEGKGYLKSEILCQKKWINFIKVS